MKQELKLGLIGVVIIVLLTVYFSIQYQQGLTALNNPGVPTPSFPIGGGNTVLTAVEVAKHNQPNDCWIIFENKVYNLVVSHLQNHPGGASIITPFCGQDGTQAFLTKSGQGSHSNTAFQQLGLYYIGNLNAQISQQNLNNLISNPPVVNNRGRESDD